MHARGSTGAPCGLDIRVVAEQVEDREALAAVRELGVDFVQGFAIGRPRPLTVA